jgi:hypothetical protein
MIPTAIKKAIALASKALFGVAPLRELEDAVASKELEQSYPRCSGHR